MQKTLTPNGTCVSWEQHGSGPPLVLVHGSFTDHRTNWEAILPALADQFSVYAIARRGRGETDATIGHRVEDEAKDVASVIASVEEPVLVLGHSYGAQVALAAVKEAPEWVRKLILYEPPSTQLIDEQVLRKLEEFAEAQDWERFSCTFFSQVTLMPDEELDALQTTDLWPEIVQQAKSTLPDLQALPRYEFHPEHFRDLEVPVTLQVGSESPPHLYVTKALASALPRVAIQTLDKQAHEAMMTAPDRYAEAVIRASRRVE